MTAIFPLVGKHTPNNQMFANTETEAQSSETTQTTTGGQYFDSRSEIHEVYWIAVDANRRNGPQILQHPNLHTKQTGEEVSGVVDDYRFFQEQKQNLIEEITGELDMYGLRKYREDFPEPDEDLWVEAGSEYYGIPIAGVHQIPEDEARERFGVDYSQDGVDPIYVPILEVEGQEIVYDPEDYYEGQEPEESTEESETKTTDDTMTAERPTFPADPADVQTWLEERDYDSLNLQERATLAKLRDPTKSNRDIAAEIDCSKNTVRKGLKKFLGDDGYDAVKARGKELRKQETGNANGAESAAGTKYAEKMSASDTDGEEEEAEASSDAEDNDSEPEMVEVPREEFEELKARLERLERLFNLDELDN